MIRRLCYAFWCKPRKYLQNIQYGNYVTSPRFHGTALPKRVFLYAVNKLIVIGSVRSSSEIVLLVLGTGNQYGVEGVGHGRRGGGPWDHSFDHTKVKYYRGVAWRGVAAPSILDGRRKHTDERHARHDTPRPERSASSWLERTRHTTHSQPFIDCFVNKFRISIL